MLGFISTYLTLQGFGLASLFAGKETVSATKSLFEYYPKKIQLDNWLQIGDGKICRVIWAYHDEMKKIFYARLSVNDGYRYVEAGTKMELEQKISEVFATL